MQNLRSFKELLSSPKNVVITTHHKPDADALGSSLGLYAFLQKKGHNVTVISPTDYPEFLHWMPGNERVIVYESRDEEKARILVEDAEVIFCLDFSSLDRINNLGELVRKAKASKVLIDHHQDPEDFADFVQWSTQAAATAELIYDLVKDMGEVDLIDKDIAECLYAGIMTDTGSFRHPNTTRNIHLITADLIAHGADVSKVSKLIYDTNSVDRMKLMGYALSQKLVVLEKYHTAYIALGIEDLYRFNAKTGDTEGLVNYALSIKGVVFAAVMIDRKEAIRISFRSTGDFSVNEFAKAHFEGGGHKNASGGKSNLTLDQTIEKFEKLLINYKDKLNTNPKTYSINVDN